MSFLENPFAEDEEPVEEPIVSGNPFGDYDTTQRENEYNALFVQSTTLEERLRKLSEQRNASVSDRAQETAQVWGELENLSVKAATHATTLASAPSSSSVKAAAEATAREQLKRASALVLADGENQLEGIRAKAATFSQAVRAFRDRIDTQTAIGEEPHNQQDAAHEGILAKEQLTFDTTSLEECVRQLIDLQNKQTDDEDTELVAALLAHTRALLRRHQACVAEATSAHHQLRRRLRFLRGAEQVAGYVGRAWVREAEGAEEESGHGSAAPARKGRRLEGEAAPAPTLEEREGEMANEDLAREIVRLETVIAAALRTSAAPSPSATPSDDTASGTGLESVAPVFPRSREGMQYAAATALAHARRQREELARRNEELGKEILFLRGVVLSEDGERASPAWLAGTPSQAASSGLGGGACGDSNALTSNNGSSSVESLERTLVERSAAMDSLFSAGAGGAAAERVPPMRLERHVLQTRITFAEHFEALQAACFAALASINEQLQKQAYGATLLTQLVVHDTGFDATVVGRLGDVPAPQLPPPGSEGETDRAPSVEEVAEWYLTSSAASPQKDLTRLSPSLVHELSATMAAEAASWDSRQAAWGKLNAALVRMLSLPEAEVPEATDGGDSAGGALPPTLVLCGKEDCPNAVAAELADAKQMADQVVRDISRALAQRRAELEKKLLWFGKQTHAAPLKSLRAITKECVSLSSRLEAFQGIVSGAESAQAQLPILQERKANVKNSISALEAEAGDLQREIQAIQQALHSLNE